MNIKSLHQELLREIIKNSKKATQHTFSDNYLGNSNPRYAISMPKLRTVGKNWFKTKQFSSKEFYQFVTSLVKAPSSTEKMLGGIFLDFDRKHVETLDPKILESWLDHLQGWAEVDTLCYGHFKVDSVLENWPAWKKTLNNLNKSENINKRRASIVLLCKPLTRSEDERLSRHAFQMIDALKSERDILITKAISWTLRSMVKLHRSDLGKYLDKNKTSLPAIAVRETTTKLKTGRKNG